MWKLFEGGYYLARRALSAARDTYTYEANIHGIIPGSHELVLHGCFLLIVLVREVSFYIVSHRKLQIRSFPAAKRMK